MLFYIVYILLWIPLHLIFPTKIIGKKNLPKKGKMIFSANHQTVNDVLIVGIHLPRKFKYMGKGPLFKNRFIGWFLTKMGAYPVHHGQNDIASVKKTLKFLKEDRAVCIFPEGSRLTSDEKNQLQNGVVMFSLKSKAPIVPAMFMKKTLAFRKNTLMIGKPLKLYDQAEFQNIKLDKATLEKASNILREAIYSLKRKYIEMLQDKVYQKYQRKIIKLERKKAKVYTFAKNINSITSLDSKIHTIETIKNQKIAKIQ